jgi:hypothetical protein
MEEWKGVKGFEESYQVSNLGSVRSLDRILIDKNGNKHTFKGKILKQCTDKYGYLRVNLYNNHCQRKFVLVHRLVAEAFIPNPDNLPQVNHKSEVKTDNSVANLEWCDNKYNCNYGTKNERCSERNTNNPKYSKWVIKLSKNNEILHFYPSAQQAQRETGISADLIYRVCNQKTYMKEGYLCQYHTAGDYIWKYAE